MLGIYRGSSTRFFSHPLVRRCLSTEVNGEVAGKSPFGRKKGEKIVRKYPVTSKAELIELWKATATNESPKLNTLPASSWPKLLNSLLEVIQNEAKEGKRVTLTGFGKFFSVHIPARSRRNPSSGDTVQSEAKDRLRFHSSPNIYQKKSKSEKTEDENDSE